MWLCSAQLVFLFFGEGGGLWYRKLYVYGLSVSLLAIGTS